MRLIQISVAETDDDTPFLVSRRPWTIHGWRPFSVSIQPAVLMRNGTMITHGASHRNHLARPSRLRWASHAAHSAYSRIRLPR